MKFESLSNDELIAAYLNAHTLKLDPSFLDILLKEIIQRDIYELLFETSLRA